jgi:hypothetical protein
MSIWLSPSESKLELQHLGRGRGRGRLHEAGAAAQRDGGHQGEADP